MSIILVIVFSVLVAAAFIGTFLVTGDTWWAADAGGFVALLYLIVFLYRTTRPPMSPRLRWWTIAASTVVIAGTIVAWTFLYITTHFQYEALHHINKLIRHDISLKDILRAKGVKTLSEYYGQQGSKKLSLGEIFQRGTQYIQPDSALIEINQDARLKLFAAAVTDTEVVLIVQASIRIDGEDPSFRNFDGQVGAMQDHLRISRKGLIYEIQN